MYQCSVFTFQSSSILESIDFYRELRILCIISNKKVLEVEKVNIVQFLHK